MFDCILSMQSYKNNSGVCGLHTFKHLNVKNVNILMCVYISVVVQSEWIWSKPFLYKSFQFLLIYRLCHSNSVCIMNTVKTMTVFLPWALRKLNMPWETAITMTTTIVIILKQWPGWHNQPDVGSIINKTTVLSPIYL